MRLPSVTIAPEALDEVRTLMAADGLDGIAPERRVLRIGIGSCGLRRPVAAPSLPEAGDSRLVVEGIPVAVASTLDGDYRIGIGRGRFGAWLTVEAV